MAYEEFFTDKDKPYSENLNDALCLVDAFDLTVPLNMPAGFSNGEFSSNIGITRKCGVGLVTLMSKDSGVTIGTDSIAGSGEVVFRIYPNFNSFYKWSRILLTKTGNVTVGFRRVDGTDISVTLDNQGNISDNTDLKELKEIDIVLTLSSATISQILIWFVNNQTTGRVRSSALLEASQLANVNGQVVTGNTEAVNGGTVKTALDNFEVNVVDEKIDDLSDRINSIINNMKKWTSVSVTNGFMEVNDFLKLVHFQYSGSLNVDPDNLVSLSLPIRYTAEGVSKYIRCSNEPSVYADLHPGELVIKSNEYSGQVSIKIDEIWRYE